MTGVKTQYQLQAETLFFCRDGRACIQGTLPSLTICFSKA